SYPAKYRNALFFADFTRNCIWAMPAGANGLPDPAQGETFASGAGPVSLRSVSSMGGDLFYADLIGGAIHRIGLGPTAVIRADRTSGPAPLTVALDGTGSSDATPGALAYSWDLTGTGVYG